jgi:hypothetical protein
MIHTVRCHRCGQAIEAFIDSAAGIPMGMTQQVVQTKVQTARIRHADTCPARRLLTSPPVPGHPPAQPSRAHGAGALAGVLQWARRRMRRFAL